MPRNPLPNRAFRIEDELWEAYDEVCSDRGMTRGEDLRAYIRREVTTHRRRTKRDGESESGHSSS